MRAAQLNFDMRLILSLIIICFVCHCVGHKIKKFNPNVQPGLLVNEWRSCYRALLDFRGNGNSIIVKKWLDYMIALEKRPEFKEKIGACAYSTRLKNYLGLNNTIIATFGALRKPKSCAENLSSMLDLNRVGCMADNLSGMKIIEFYLDTGVTYQKRYIDSLRIINDRCMRMYHNLLSQYIKFFGSSAQLIWNIYYLIPTEALIRADTKFDHIDPMLLHYISIAIFRNLSERGSFDDIIGVQSDLNEIKWNIGEIYESEIRRIAKDICDFSESVMFAFYITLDFLRNSNQLFSQPGYTLNETNFVKLNCIISNNEYITDNILLLLRTNTIWSVRSIS